MSTSYIYPIITNNFINKPWKSIHRFKFSNTNSKLLLIKKITVTVCRSYEYKITSLKSLSSKEIGEPHSFLQTFDYWSCFKQKYLIKNIVCFVHKKQALLWNEYGQTIWDIIIHQKHFFMKALGEIMIIKNIKLNFRF